MATAAAQTYFTPEEYIKLEQKADCKSEYYAGHIIAMAGASFTHNLIKADIVTELNNRLKKGNCVAISSDMRVRLSPGETYVYPDVVVVCGEPEFEDDTFDTLLNPIVIVEVLSPSTEAYDRGDKFTRYKQLASLQEYLLVSQDKVQVEHYRRHGEQWILSNYRAREDILRLSSIGCYLSLRDIYARVTVHD